MTLTVRPGHPCRGGGSSHRDPAPSALRVVGESLAYRATAVFTDKTSADVTIAAVWNSSVPTVASVDSTGGAKALNAGPTTISATMSGVTGQSTSTSSPEHPATTSIRWHRSRRRRTAGRSTEAPAIVGTATDANFLRYELAVAPGGTTDWTVIRRALRRSPAARSGSSIRPRSSTAPTRCG